MTFDGTTTIHAESGAISMGKYVVLTTPTCTSCRILKKLVVAKNLGEKVSFVDALTPEGQKVMERSEIRSAGQILQVDTNTIITLEELLYAEAV